MAEKNLSISIYLSKYSAPSTTSTTLKRKTRGKRFTSISRHRMTEPSQTKTIRFLLLAQLHLSLCKITLSSVLTLDAGSINNRSIILFDLGISKMGAARCSRAFCLTLIGILDLSALVAEAISFFLLQEKSVFNVSGRSRTLDIHVTEL